MGVLRVVDGNAARARPRAGTGGVPYRLQPFDLLALLGGKYRLRLPVLAPPAGR
jgi:hypothetical protein